MNTLFKEAAWSQFGAAIEMLENAIRSCPEEVWLDDLRPTPYWYLAFHTLFWLDLYLSGSSEGFRPPQPFTLDEMMPDGESPTKPYSQAEILAYLEHGRRKCFRVVDELTEARARQRCRFGWGEASFAELLIYNLRHVQHGAAQLNLMLRQSIDMAPSWVAQAGTSNS